MSKAAHPRRTPLRLSPDRPAARLHDRVVEVLRQLVFPQENLWENRQTGEQGRHHVHESLVQKSVRKAVRKAGLTKRVTSHVFRHSFATDLLADGYDIRTVQNSSATRTFARR